MGVWHERLDIFSLWHARYAALQKFFNYTILHCIP